MKYIKKFENLENRIQEYDFEKEYEIFKNF